MNAAATWEGIDTVFPMPDNPRKNTEAVQPVADSIKRFGFGAPLVARKSDRVLIAGHTRLQAAQLLGLDKVPVRFVDLDPAEARALALADNRLGEIAAWDDEQLREVIAGLDADGVDVSDLGWSDDELSALLEEPPAPEPDTDAEPLAPPAQPVSKAGEVYQLGPHRLICGDCRDPEVVARLVDGARVNVAFTSPPYASQRKYDESSGFKPIKPEAYVDWFDAVQAGVRSALADDGSWFVNIKEHCDDGQRSLYVKDLTIAHVRQWGWRFVDELGWARSAVPMQMKHAIRFKNEIEPVFHFSRDRKPKFRPRSVMSQALTVPSRHTRRKYTTTDSGFQTGFDSACGEEAYPSNLLWINNGSTAVFGHSGTFPVGLPAFFIKAYSDPGDIIFDPFMGSGTTMIAAANEKRIAMGCEISPAYCDIIRQRWSQWCAKNGEDPGADALPVGVG